MSIEDNFVPIEQLTREQRRSRRKRAVRGRTVSMKRMTKIELDLGRVMYPETDYWRPKTRGECLDGPRPCPYVACRYNLYLSVSSKTGAIKFNFPDLEVDEMGESCALDVADHGGTPHEHVGEMINVTRERVRQIEFEAKKKVRPELIKLLDYLPQDESDGRGETRTEGDDEIFVDEFIEQWAAGIVELLDTNPEAAK